MTPVSADNRVQQHERECFLQGASLTGQASSQRRLARPTRCMPRPAEHMKTYGVFWMCYFKTASKLHYRCPLQAASRANWARSLNIWHIRQLQLCQRLRLCYTEGQIISSARLA